MSDDSYGVATASDTVRLERRLPGPAERIWAYLTQPDKRRQWLADGTMDLRPGGTARLVFRHANFTDEDPPARYRAMNETGVACEGRILECDPPRVLAMTWPGDGESSVVRFELFPDGDRTLLVITHSRLADGDAMANVSSGWHAHLAVLAAVLAGAPTPPFWSRITALEADYRERFSRQ
ncbi:SRPBCC family protein [Aquibium sp. A9E412]|uniref:SRPBCC family protein n=1 Tax=Aquibium sp. A9E412 TaxID=2976767 RepID=UPI0025B0AE99|nr:SRPBCC family protein [Aquibium sp. A9E412]MDN2566430.1 SRPBCC family protein [Aquibium sp. A9E412]